MCGQLIHAQTQWNHWISIETPKMTHQTISKCDRLILEWLQLNVAGQNAANSIGNVNFIGWSAKKASLATCQFVGQIMISIGFQSFYLFMVMYEKKENHKCAFPHTDNTATPTEATSYTRTRFHLLCCSQMCQLHDNGILLRPIDKWSKQVKCAIKWMFKLWRLECASAGPSVKPF